MEVVDSFGNRLVSLAGSVDHTANYPSQADHRISRTVTGNLASGWAKATFQRQLEAARIEAESLPSEPNAPEQERIVPETEERRFLRLAASSPESAIMDAYKNIEAILLDDIAPFLGVRAADPVVIANQMMQRGLINQATFDLFQTLRRARNVAAHIAPGRITSQEAIDYGDHATTLRFRFSYALGRLRGEGEHKPKE